MLRHRYIWIVGALLLALNFVATSASAAEVTDLVGGVSWGMNRTQVEANYRSELIAEYRQEIAGSRDAVRNDRLRRGVDEKIARFRDTWVELDGTRTGYESSTIADEIFTGGNLSMMIMPSADVPKYFVFKDGRLVKILIATNVASLDFMPFHSFVSTLRGVYGRPDDVQSEVDDIGVKHETRAIWTDSKSRLRIENKSAVFNTYLMVLTNVKEEDFMRDTRAASAAARTSGGTLDDLFQEVAADASNRTGDDVVDRIVGSQTQVHVRLRSDAGDGDALTSQAVGTSAMDDTEVLQDVEKVERRSSSRRSRRSGSDEPAPSSGGGRTIY